MIDNRIINGGFETGRLAPSMVSGNVFIDSSISHSGSFSAKLFGGVGTNSLTQFVPVKPGENFDFRVSLTRLGTPTSPQMAIVISYLDNGFNELGTALTVNIPRGHLPSTDEESWLEIHEATSIAPPLTTQARIVITKLSRVGSASVLVDDLALLAVTFTSSGPSGDLNVGRDLMVHGKTQLSTVRVDGTLETQSNTSFFGINNVFNNFVYVGRHLEVIPESDVIGSGSFRSGTLEVAGFLGGGVVPAETLTVRNGHIAMFGPGNGIILTAPNNTRWLLTVDNTGNLRTTSVR